MFLPVTTTIACLLAVVFIILSFRVIRVRRSAQVSLGDGGDATLQRRVRGHANLAEYGPFGVILILLAEIQGANIWLLLIAAGLFLVGRLMHAWAFGFTDHNMKLRVRGMQCTVFGLVGLIIINLAALAFSLFAKEF